MEQSGPVVRLQADAMNAFPTIIFSNDDGDGEDVYVLLAYVDMNGKLYAILVEEEICKSEERDFVVDFCECRKVGEETEYVLVEDEHVLERLADAFADAWQTHRYRLKELDAFVN